MAIICPGRYASTTNSRIQVVLDLPGGAASHDLEWGLPDMTGPRARCGGPRRGTDNDQAGGYHDDLSNRRPGGIPSGPCSYGFRT